MAVRILIIDDEEMIRTLAQRILTRAGHDVLVAESGDKGLELFRVNQSEVDLILLDYMMNGLSGIETLEQIREIAPGKPCIISTGQGIVSDEIPSNLRENTYFLQKPYRANQLAELVQQILSNN
jgi:DNA-binding NtrC family response regulator